MNIQNNNESQAYDLVIPDHKFHWGFAAGGFILGLFVALMIGGMFIAIVISQGGLGLQLSSSYSAPPPASSSADSSDLIFSGIAVGFAAAAVISPFVLATWFGKISWSGGRAIQRVETPGLEPRPSLWYGTRGRVNRLGFLVVAVVMTFVLSLLGFAIEFLEARSPGSSHTIMWPVVAVELGIVGLGISLIVRRLHDLGFSGFFAAISLIPVCGQVFWITLLVVPGNNRPNKYGPQPRIVGVAAIFPSRQQ